MSVYGPFKRIPARTEDEATPSQEWWRFEVDAHHSIRAISTNKVGMDGTNVITSQVPQPLLLRLSEHKYAFFHIENEQLFCFPVLTCEYRPGLFLQNAPVDYTPDIKKHLKFYNRIIRHYEYILTGNPSVTEVINTISDLKIESNVIKEKPQEDNSVLLHTKLFGPLLHIWPGLSSENLEWWTFEIKANKLLGSLFRKKGDMEWEEIEACRAPNPLCLCKLSGSEESYAFYFIQDNQLSFVHLNKSKNKLCVKNEQSAVESGGFHDPTMIFKALQYQPLNQETLYQAKLAMALVKRPVKRTCLLFSQKKPVHNHQISNENHTLDKSELRSLDIHVKCKN